VILAEGDRRQVLTDGAILRPGKVSVLADVFDLREDVRFSWPLAPYSIAVSLDGIVVARIVFDSSRCRKAASLWDRAVQRATRSMIPKG